MQTNPEATCERTGGENSEAICEKLLVTLGSLKRRLEASYEQTLPGRGPLIRQAVAEAEELAWQTSFPHLFLPDFAEGRLTEIIARHESALAEAA